MDPGEVVALVVSALLGVIAWKQRERHAALDQRLGAIELARREEELEARARANVTAEIERETGRRAVYLVVTNAGPAAARDVSIAEPPGTIVRGWPFPMANLAPGPPVRALIQTTNQTPRHATVVLRWTDGRGPQAIDVVLSLK